VVDVGGGRGELLNLIEKKFGCAIVLVEKSEYRFEGDDENVGKYQRENGNFVQIIERFENVNLEEYHVIREREVVFVMKHLCDAQLRTPALEMALSHICSFKEKLKIKAILFSPCCNGKVDFDLLYPFYHEKFHKYLTKEEFITIVKKSSWATIKNFSKIKKKKHKQKNDLQLYHKKCGEVFDLFLDFARIQFLEENDFEVFRTEFVDRTITPKNRLYIALPQTPTNYQNGTWK